MSAKAGQEKLATAGSGQPNVGPPRCVWLISGASIGALYPCRCGERGGRDCGKDGPWGCPCYGRNGAELMPDACCSRRYLAPSQRRLTY